MSDYRAAISAELERLEEDMLFTEKGHFVAAEELKRAHRWLGLIATVSAAAAAATIVADNSPVVSGSLALVAALASAMLTFVKPEEGAAQHLSAARVLGAVRVLARQNREVDLHPDAMEDRTAWRKYVAEIGAAKKEADAAAPSISDRRFEKARRKIDAGHFVHGAASGSSSSSPRKFRLRRKKTRDYRGGSHRRWVANILGVGTAAGQQPLEVTSSSASSSFACPSCWPSLELVLPRR